MVEAASGLGVDMQRARKAARSCLQNLATERKRVWDHARVQISLMLGHCVRLLFDDVAQAMSNGGMLCG